MAATVTAHLWAAGTGRPETAEAPAALGRGEETPAIGAGADADDDIDPESRIVMARIRKLGELHAEGLLTDEEFSAKKAELLERL
ncbi:SHOCT domain-containing protein [Nocardiopsis composta]